jgi:hypothetical protein
MNINILYEDILDDVEEIGSDARTEDVPLISSEPLRLSDHRFTVMMTLSGKHLPSGIRKSGGGLAFAEHVAETIRQTLMSSRIVIAVPPLTVRGPFEGLLNDVYYKNGEYDELEFYSFVEFNAGVSVRRAARFLETIMRVMDSVRRILNSPRYGNTSVRITVFGGLFRVLRASGLGSIYGDAHEQRSSVADFCTAVTGYKVSENAPEVMEELKRLDK